MKENERESGRSRRVCARVPSPFTRWQSEHGVPDLTPEDGRFRAEAKQPSGLPVRVEQLGGGRADSTQRAHRDLMQC